MADTSYPFDARRRRPRDWGEALAALPLETPPLSVWTQIAARLDGSASDGIASDDLGTAASDGVSTLSVAPSPSPLPLRRRAGLSFRSWVALAASLSALALLPAIWFAGRDDGAQPSPTVASAPARPAIASSAAVSGQASDISKPERAGDETTQVASVVREQGPATDSAPLQASIVAAPATSATMPIETAALPTSPPLASVAPPTISPSPLALPDVADATNEVDALPPGAVLVGDADADVTGREMEMLYAASAQLETLLTYTRDPRMETGPAAALASQIHTRLAKIDARLALPGLSAHEQYALWQARVGTLRQALAFESEQRALAAEGQVYEGQLVEVY